MEEQDSRTVELEEAVLEEISEHPEASTRKISQTFNVSHMTVCRILREQNLYSYLIQCVQALTLRDFQPVVSGILHLNSLSYMYL